jgi:protein subunit release factor A
MTAYLEIRTSEGGQDAKLLVEDMATLYQKVANANHFNFSTFS